jgi:hypothetical protein
MGRGISFIGLVIVLVVGGYFYTSQLKEIAPDGKAPKSTVNVIGVRNDLLSMANAEKRYWVSNAKYASLDELRSFGDTPVPTRPDFRYSADAGSNTFTITATYLGSDPQAPKHFSIDDTLTITTN